MAFKRAEATNNIDTDEILIQMINSPKNLKIVDVGEFKHSDNQKEDYKYFYVTFGLN